MTDILFSKPSVINAWQRPIAMESEPIQTMIVMSSDVNKVLPSLTLVTLALMGSVSKAVMFHTYVYRCSKMVILD